MSTEQAKSGQLRASGGEAQQRAVKDLSTPAQCSRSTQTTEAVGLELNVGGTGPGGTRVPPDPRANSQNNANPLHNPNAPIRDPPLVPYGQDPHDVEGINAVAVPPQPGKLATEFGVHPAGDNDPTIPRISHRDGVDADDRITHAINAQAQYLSKEHGASQVIVCGNEPAYEGRVAQDPTKPPGHMMTVPTDLRKTFLLGNNPTGPQSDQPQVANMTMYSHFYTRYPYANNADPRDHRVPSALSITAEEMKTTDAWSGTETYAVKRE